MGKNDEQIQVTQHAFLVAWGQFAQEKGLVERLMSVKLRQKTRQHRPQSKVLEFLVAILGGTRQLQDISLAAHPLDKDQAVAEAWGQPAWADYSDVSRTLSSLSWEEAQSIVKALDEFSQPFLAAEVEFRCQIPARVTRTRLTGTWTMRFDWAIRPGWSVW